MQSDLHWQLFMGLSLEYTQGFSTGGGGMIFHFHAAIIYKWPLGFG